MTAATAAGPANFDIGRVIAISLGVYRRRWGTILTLVLVPWALREAAMFAQLGWLKQAGNDAPSVAAYMAVLIAFLIVGLIEGAAITSAALERPNDRRSLAYVLQSGLRVFFVLLPYFALMDGPDLILRGLVVGAPPARIDLPLGPAGFFWAATPVLWLYRVSLSAFFGLTLPAALVKGGGVIAAMRRSAALLTLGRWRFLCLVIFMSAAGALPVGLSYWLIQPLPHGGFRYPVGSQIADLVNALVAALWFVIVAVSYKEFRRLREGVASDEVDEIFA